MEIIKKKEGSQLIIAVEGKIDTSTSPELETAVRSDIDSVDNLIFDFEKVTYISSTGLRVLLSAQKIMNKQGRMVIRNVSSSVMDIFDITGFVDILDIE